MKKKRLLLKDLKPPSRQSGRAAPFSQLTHIVIPYKLLASFTLQGERDKTK